jgi:hypothetical protein
MLYEKIDRGYLNRHLNRIHKLNDLRKLKFEILDSCGLHAYDYSALKVTSGSKRLSTQERAILRVENINKQIKNLESMINPVQKDLALQIERVDSATDDWRHAEILKMLYLDGCSMKDVILNFYPEDNKNARSSIEGLRKTAEKTLAKISSTPFIKINQLIIEDWQNEST